MGLNVLSYRILFFWIFENIIVFDLEKLKFFCLDFILDGELEIIDLVLKFFKVLERCSKLVENDLMFLCYLLINVNCFCLLYVIGDFVIRCELELLGFKI